MPALADAPSRTADGGGGEAPHRRVVVVGAGFAGIGMAIKLSEAGIDDFAVLERDAEIGGTWWANSYPGCQCDIPSHLYSFSFAPNPEWSRTYAPQPEIERYLLDLAERRRVRDRVRLGCELEAADWDEEACRWRLETSDGPLTADLVVAAPGPLSEPRVPPVPGLDGFEGAAFHTARWDHGVELRGRRVAVVGTGASAIQVVPRLQPVVERLTVFQRTPPWVVPHGDRAIGDWERALYRRVPALQRLVRGGVYASRELLVPGLVHSPALMKAPERIARRHLERQVPDPELRARLTPDYRIGCKRILPSNHWYPALTRPNVDVELGGLERVHPSGVATPSGELREVDAIVFATGFQVADFPLAHRVRGRDGATLAEAWGGSPRAHRGAAVAGFPNMFWLVGPNTGLGHNSIVYMIESQLAYVMDALRALERAGADRVEVRPEAQRAYDEDLQARMAGTVWTSGGCSSWYLDANGRNTTIWPGFTWRFRRQTRRFDREAYALARAPARAAGAA